MADISNVIEEKQLWGKGYELEIWLVVWDYLCSRDSILKITGRIVVTNEQMVSISHRDGTQDRSPALIQGLVGGELMNSTNIQLVRRAA